MENSVSIRQGKPAWDSGQGKSRMHNQVIIKIIYVHTKSQKHRKMEGKVPQRSLSPSQSSKSFAIPCCYLSSLLSKMSTPPINTTFPCLAYENGKMQHSVPG